MGFMVFFWPLRSHQHISNVSSRHEAKSAAIEPKLTISVIIPKIIFCSGKLVVQERSNADNAASTPPTRHNFCFMVKTRSERQRKEMMCVVRALNPCGEKREISPVRRTSPAITAEWTARNAATAMNRFFVILPLLFTQRSEAPAAARPYRADRLPPMVSS